MSKKEEKEKRLFDILSKIKEAGIKSDIKRDEERNKLESLSNRIQAILQILKKQMKSSEMNYLIFYDIADDKVRVQISKYLIKRGCKRIQKSVFLARSENKHFQQILADLKEVNSLYENNDSIILVPINSSDVRGMQLIGMNVDLTLITDKPSTLFF
jgi:CRISPR-associated endonuclease Cas2